MIVAVRTIAEFVLHTEAAGSSSRLLARPGASLQSHHTFTVEYQIGRDTQLSEHVQYLHHHHADSMQLR